MSAEERNQSLSLRRALGILSYVRQRADVSLSEVSDALRLNKSTVLRLAGPLQDAGLLVREAGRFRLGLGALELGQAYLSTLDIREVAAGPLRGLQAASRQTCHLAVPDGTEIVYIDKVEDTASVRMASAIGRRAPMYCTAVGKAILAWLGDTALSTVVSAGLPAVTDRTITDPARLAAELATVRERGYAVDDREHEPDVRCVAAPIFDHERRVVGALSVSGLASRLTPEATGELAPAVSGTGWQISQRLGCPTAGKVGKA